MTNGGLLGDCKSSGEGDSTPPVVDAELYRLIDAGAKAEADRKWQPFRADQDQFMRVRLWEKYQEDIAALNLAPVTLRKYERAMAKFAESCAEANVSALPAAVGTGATYLDYKLSRGAGAETIRCIVAAIGRAHEAWEETDPTTAPLVRGIVRAARTYKRTKLNGKAKNGAGH